MTKLPKNCHNQSQRGSEATSDARNASKINSFDREEEVLDLDIRLAKAVNHLTIALAEYKKFEKEAIRKWGRDKYYINAGDPLEDALSEITCAMITDIEYRLKEKHNLI